ncbi:MAG: zinc ribbon domain-containing protein [Defluviitaleaceae bacterium]|nr:zinc ribbon domain-containing protein [Defluviitaleaceae bacterium]MCL2273650.1 zinc ribbon domain-containing protein [Defluviitaleaceae bacterium]
MNKTFCSKCGAKLNEGGQFCIKCGAKCDNATTGNVINNPDSHVPSTEVENKPQTLSSKLIGGIITIIIVVAGAWLINNVILGGGGNQPINVVRNGYFEAFPNLSVGRAFNNFYADANWSSFEDARGNMVRFTGSAEWMGQPATFTWYFRVQGTSFELAAIQLDGDGVPIAFAPSWLETVFLSQ